MIKMTRRILLGGAALGLGAIHSASLWAQDRKFGADAGGEDHYPGGYVVKAPPVPSGRTTFATVKQGRLQGIEANGIRYFRGIPFAAAPVGPLRFKPPQPPASWKGVRLALDNPPASLQPNIILEAPSTSEDCLYLNIWAPSSPGPHPVYVYIHGGGNTSGYSLEHRVNGASFARDGIVCVNIGYRLGVFGFLELGAVLGPEYRGSGNNALRDQIAALVWVRDNVAAFGGDPANVTIGGQSAGAINVLSLAVSPHSEGLFRRGIAQSGSGHGTSTLEAANDQARQFAQALLGVGGTASDILTVSASRITALQGAIFATGSMNGVIDGDFLLDHPYAATRSGQGRNIGLLLGANRDEMAILGGGGDPTKFPPARQLAFARFAAANPTLSLSQQAMRFVSETLLIAPTKIYADNHAAAGGSSYVYEWTWSAQTGRFHDQAFHGIETPFVWDNVGALAFRFVEPDPSFVARARDVHQLWTSFIRSGRPSAPHLPDWRPWTPDDRAYLDIGKDYTIREADADELGGWKALLEHKTVLRTRSP